MRMLSVIVPTRNRANDLSRCLDAVAAVERPAGPFEILVVDNGSTDATPDVLRRESRRARLPLRWVVAPEPGVASARNRGVREAQGEVLLFLDDDVLVAPTWLAAYADAFRTQGTAIAQGRTLVRVMGPRPTWLADFLLPAFGHVDRGTETGGWPGDLVTANLGVARRVFDEIGLFRPDLGPGTPAGFGEDTEWGQRAAAAGLAAVYLPDAVGRHVIPARRISRAATVRRAYLCGRSLPLFTDYEEWYPRTLVHFFRQAATRLATALWGADTAGQTAELSALAAHLGGVLGIAKQRVAGASPPGRTSRTG